jgi:hypothetical protein
MTGLSINARQKQQKRYRARACLDSSLSSSSSSIFFVLPPATAILASQQQQSASYPRFIKVSAIGQCQDQCGEWSSRKMGSRKYDLNYFIKGADGCLQQKKHFFL